MSVFRLTDTTSLIDNSTTIITQNVTCPHQDLAESLIGVNAFLFILIILCSLLLGYFIKVKRLYWIPESGANMIIGFVIGLLISSFSPKHAVAFSFDPDVFFFYLLPPVIFEAGYTLNQQDFFRNIGSAASFAFIGTILSTITFALMMFGLANVGAVPLSTGDPLECFLFGSAISATDTVATVAIVGSPEVNADPLLFSLVFGESVLNDAVAIVLYKTFLRFVAEPFSFLTALTGVGLFFLISIGSTVIGALVGLVCCLLFKYVDFSSNIVYEFTITMLFAYFSYFTAEVLELSGIMSLFFCAVVQAHYSHDNISHETAIACHHAFKSFSLLAEQFVFTYMGITLGVSLSPYTPDMPWDLWMALWTLIGCQISRAANIFPMAALSNRYRDLKIPFRFQLPMWFAGARGAVAFALAMGIPTENAEYIKTSTLATVVISTIIVGTLTLPLLKITNTTGTDLFKEYWNQPFMPENMEKKMRHAWLARKWLTFDAAYPKRFFGGRYKRKMQSVSSDGSVSFVSSGAVDDSDSSIHFSTDHSKLTIHAEHAAQEAAAALEATEHQQPHHGGGATPTAGRGAAAAAAATPTGAGRTAATATPTGAGRGQASSSSRTATPSHSAQVNTTAPKVELTSIAVHPPDASHDYVVQTATGLQFSTIDAQSSSSSSSSSSADPSTSS